jgi:hypothetical protein
MLDLVAIIDATLEQGHYGGSSRVVIRSGYRMGLLRADATRRNIGLCHESAVLMVRASLIGGNILSCRDDDAAVGRELVLNKSCRGLEKIIDLSLESQDWDNVMMTVMLRKAEAALHEVARCISLERRSSLTESHSPAAVIAWLPDPDTDTPPQPPLPPRSGQVG